MIQTNLLPPNYKKLNLFKNLATVYWYLPRTVCIYYNWQRLRLLSPIKVDSPNNIILNFFICKQVLWYMLLQKINATLYLATIRKNYLWLKPYINEDLNNLVTKYKTPVQLKNITLNRKIYGIITLARHKFQQILQLPKQNTKLNNILNYTWFKLTQFYGINRLLYIKQYFQFKTIYLFFNFNFSKAQFNYPNVSINHNLICLPRSKLYFLFILQKYNQLLTKNLHKQKQLTQHLRYWNIKITQNLNINYLLTYYDIQRNIEIDYNTMSVFFLNIHTPLPYNWYGYMLHFYIWNLNMYHWLYFI